VQDITLKTLEDQRGQAALDRSGQESLRVGDQVRSAKCLAGADRGRGRPRGEFRFSQR
jgi:hypothetical protein